MLIIDGLISNASPQAGYSLVIHELPSDTDMKSFADAIGGKLKQQIAVIFCDKSGKLSILVAVGKELLPKYNAGKIVAAIAATLGGKGGGRADSAMAGCAHPGDLNPIIAKIPDLIASIL